MAIGIFLMQYINKCYYLDKDLTFYRISTQNESNNSIHHAMWICYEYGIIKYILKYYHFLNFIVKPYLQEHSIILEKII